MPESWWWYELLLLWIRSDFQLKLQMKNALDKTFAVNSHKLCPTCVQKVCYTNTNEWEWCIAYIFKILSGLRSDRELAVNKEFVRAFLTHVYIKTKTMNSTSWNHIALRGQPKGHLVEEERFWGNSTTATQFGITQLTFEVQVYNALSFWQFKLHYPNWHVHAGPFTGFWRVSNKGMLRLLYLSLGKESLHYYIGYKLRIKLITN